jgi:adenylate kinase family enzyme
MDGIASVESIKRRVEATDTIIFIDLPLWIHYWWVVKNKLKRRYPTSLGNRINCLRLLFFKKC